MRYIEITPNGVCLCQSVLYWTLLQGYYLNSHLLCAGKKFADKDELVQGGHAVRTPGSRFMAGSLAEADSGSWPAVGACMSIAVAFVGPLHCFGGRLPRNHPRTIQRRMCCVLLTCSLAWLPSAFMLHNQVVTHIITCLAARDDCMRSSEAFSTGSQVLGTDDSCIIKCLFNTSDQSQACECVVCRPPPPPPPPPPPHPTRTHAPHAHTCAQPKWLSVTIERCICCVLLACSLAWLHPAIMLVTAIIPICSSSFALLFDAPPPPPPPQGLDSPCFGSQAFSIWIVDEGRHCPKRN